MNYSQIFQDHYGMLPPVVRAICQGLDEQEQWLESIRVQLGLDPNWHPKRIRESSAPPNSAVTWSAKANAMNGVGDMRTLIGEICGWLDAMEEKKREIAERLTDRKSV